MKIYYAKQFQVGSDIKVHAFKSMQERDTWVEEHYDDLGARQCSAVEAKQLAKAEDFIEH
jgi:cell wall assembly regulator SMI1